VSVARQPAGLDLLPEELWEQKATINAILFIV